MSTQLAPRPAPPVRAPAVLPPRHWGLRRADIVAFVGFNFVLIAGMWLRHNSLNVFTELGGGLTAIGQLTGLFGTFLVLIQLALMARMPWLDELIGLPRLAAWHRWTGFGSVTLLVAHTGFIIAGYAAADGSSIGSETWALLTTYPDVLMATVALGLLLVVAVTSVKLARARVRHETWYFVHLYAYLAIALGFAHQLAVGSDFIHDSVARVYWIVLTALAVGFLLVFRVGRPLRAALRHQLRVTKVVKEAPGVVSIYLTGRRLEELSARAGQFFLWRFLTRQGWWRAHPFSLSAPANGRFLRITVKESGDYTSDLQRLRPGVRVFAEGPYGAMTGLARRQRKVALIAGGVGITPLRALAEEQAGAPDDVVLVYRASRPEDFVFKRELDELARRRAVVVHYLAGSRRSPTGDPLQPEKLRALVPDIRHRDVFVCGPPGMTLKVLDSLHRLGVPPEHVHQEAFSY